VLFSVAGQGLKFSAATACTASTKSTFLLTLAGRKLQMFRHLGVAASPREIRYYATKYFVF